MWIILFFLVEHSFALESFEKLKNIRILKIYPKNVILINRGLEDGIMRNDHVKFNNETEGYASRGLCLKATNDSSLWKLYRLPNPKAFSKDYTYTVIGSADREMPEYIQNLRTNEYELPHDEQKIDEEEKLSENETKQEKSNNINLIDIKDDLPQKLDENDIPKNLSQESQKMFDLDKMKQDLSQYQLSVYASPYTRQSLNNGESYLVGMRGKNLGEIYELDTLIEQQKTKFKDPSTGQSFSTHNTRAQAYLTVKEVSPNYSGLSVLNFQSYYFGKLGTPASHFQIGPLGFTRHFLGFRKTHYLNISYIPLFDIRKTDIEDSSGKKSIVSTNGVRHGIRLLGKTKINDKVFFENEFWVRPFQDLKGLKLETNNLNLTNDLKLIFNLSESLFFDYNFIFQQDSLWKKLNNFTDTNIINAIHLRYDFDL